MVMAWKVVYWYKMPRGTADTTRSLSRGSLPAMHEEAISPFMTFPTGAFFSLMVKL